MRTISFNRPVDVCSIFGYRVVAVNRTLGVRNNSTEPMWFVFYEPKWWCFW